MRLIIRAAGYGLAGLASFVCTLAMLRVAYGAQVQIILYEPGFWNWLIRLAELVSHPARIPGRFTFPFAVLGIHWLLFAVIAYIPIRIGSKYDEQHLP